MRNTLPKAITIREVGPRDGLQNEARFVPTADKVRLIDALTAAGITSVQATAFVHPKAVPQMADAEEVMAAIARPAGVEFAVLVPNLRGAERAATIAADEWSIMLSASDTHSRLNANRSFADALAQVEAVVARGRAAGVRLRGGMSMSLGCPFEGKIPLDRLVAIIGEYERLGVTEVGLTDTAGVADPAHVHATARALIERFPAVRFKLHLHDTRGLGLANALAGMMAGITLFDSAIGGLGGCPFVPNATGNIATEDLVHMCELMGIETGIDLDRLLAISRMLPDLVGHGIESAVARAGSARALIDASRARVARAEEAASG